MSPTIRFRHLGRATAIVVFAVSAAYAEAGEGLRTVSIGSAASAPETRNVADQKTFSTEVAPPKPIERTDLTVTVDRAKVIRLPDKAQTVIIGNSAVADVSVQKSGVVVLTGKSFGVTNFIALDASGNMLAEANVSVKAPTDATLVVQRGLDRFTYSCTPACQPSVALGDNGAYFGDTKGQVDQHSAFAAQR